VITPRHTRLVRVDDLHAFRRAIARLVNTSDVVPSVPSVPTVVVPSRSAARQIAHIDIPHDAVTRDELYERFHARLSAPPRRLGSLEREVVAQGAARHAAAAIDDLPFRLRPGLIVEILRFYDHLRRQSQQVKRFEELIVHALGHDEVDDRAAQRMRQQTRFLASTFREYERRVAESGGLDEHALRDRLIAEAAIDPVCHVIVAVPDWIADPNGLFVADFDLLARIPGLARIDVVCTERILASGFHERLHNWLPGIEEIAASALDGFIAADAVKPVLVTPPGGAPDEPWWTLRDREEELVTFARRVLRPDVQPPGPARPELVEGRALRQFTALPPATPGSAISRPGERHAVVFKRPLPYLYIAAEVLPAAGLSFRTFDALPLAVEPGASAVDLALSAAAANFGRESLVALLRSPHFVFVTDGREVMRESMNALDRMLSDSRYLGELTKLESLLTDQDDGGARPALEAAIDAARELAPLIDAQPASHHVRRLLAFWESHLRPESHDDPLAGRERRARSAVRDALSALAGAHEAHDDPEWTIDELALAVRRTIEDHTFDVESSGDGVHLVDDQAARFGDFDDITIVGVVETDWPERPRRNIFYPPAILKSLGWPSEKDRRAAADANFLDLLGSSAQRTVISTFTLDDDALVSRSPQLDDIHRARLSTVAELPFDDAPVFFEEALWADSPAMERLDPAARTWAELRVSRSDPTVGAYHGHVPDWERSTDGVGTQTGWSVSALETYLDCPFKFFAQHVLKLEEEPDDEEVMDPRRQGQLVHEVFERFFAEWQNAGHRAITPENLDTARQLFAQVVDRALEALPEAEAGLERTRLLGSPAAAGLGEAVLRMEAERPTPVVERLLEHRLNGAFTIATATGPRTVTLRGKADRLDLLADGTFRLIDYKLGWPPNRTRALQLPIYSLCAEQRLASHRGRAWTLGEAAYLAFKGPKRVVPLFSAPAERDKVLAEAQQRVADTLDAIDRGEFPPTPDDVYRCETCTFASVCRKDYVGDV